ncbi:MAG TPA: FecR domain-containing protein [Bacteroidales bacterium]|nr:FecR domain-containing protein [Bacteroidales bacterium]
MTKGKNIDDLIAKYLAGEIMPNEEVELKKWLENSPEHEKYFDDLRFIHDKAIASRTYHRVDTRKAWDILQQKMDKASENVNVKESGRRLFIKTWTRIAASVIVIACLSILLNHFTRKNSIVQNVTIASSDTVVKQIIDRNTEVVLNRNSRVLYTATRREREVQLTGEAFFSVDQPGESNLLVKAEGTMIEDIGTSFNVRALPGENYVEVYVETGEVRFFTSANEGIKIQAGETGQYQKETGKFSVTEAQNINVTAYKTKMFIFRGATLAEVISELSDVYPEQIELGNPELADCTISVTFNNENITRILDIIAETFDLTLEKTNSGFILQGEHCNN